MTADNDVIDSDQTGERADRENDRQGRESCGQKRQTNDVGFARTPVAIEQRGGPFPIHVARTMDRATLRNDQISHFAWGDCSLGLPPLTSGFLAPDFNEILMSYRRGLINGAASGRSQ